jgi:hypothetical protein
LLHPFFFLHLVFQVCIFHTCWNFLQLSNVLIF